MVPVGAVIGAGLADKLKLKPTYALLIGTALQLIGAINFALLPDTANIQSSQYAFQVILGAGSGISNAISTISVPLVVPKKDIRTLYPLASKWACASCLLLKIVQLPRWAPIRSSGIWGEPLVSG